MSSNPGGVARQPELLSVDDANLAVDNLSDVGSFSRTRPDVDDDDDELDSSPPPEEAEEAAHISITKAVNGAHEYNDGTASPEVEVSIHVS
jgi:hypothetical protein